MRASSRVAGLFTHPDARIEDRAADRGNLRRQTANVHGDAELHAASPQLPLKLAP